MESSRPGALPVREPRRYPVAPIVFGVIGAVIAVWITVAVATSRDPEDTVEEYLTAVAEKDVEGALELVSRYGSGVPYGDAAAFLAPEAISDDWWVVSVTEVGREYDTTARVKAVIAGPGGTAEGEFVVHEYDDEWTLQDPFVSVRFPTSPLTYVRVNDKVVPKPPDSNGYEAYQLFPGIYRFYGSVPDVVTTQERDVVAAFPSEDDEIDVVPAAMTPGRNAVTGLQEKVKERIDRCATFATPAPYGDCPFATDGDIDTPDGRRVSDLHGLTWKVAGYPVVEMTDDRSREFSRGFALKVTEPGSVTLSGSGEDTDGKPTTFTVTCGIDLTGMYATIDARGEITLLLDPNATSPGRDFNTCRRNS